MPIRYEGKITSPDDNSEFRFLEEITVTGKAKRIAEDGTVTDATADIRWRDGTKGGTFRIKFPDRKNTRIAMYVKGVDVARIDVKIICDSIDPKSPPPIDQYALALIMFTEGRSCTEAEKEAIGATVLNRLQYPARFGSSVREVIEKPSQFQASKFRIYSMSIDDPGYIRTEFTYAECVEFKPVPALAAAVLARSRPITPPGFSGAPFSFKVPKNPNDMGTTHAPRVQQTGVGGFKHSFYGYDGTG